MQPARIKPHAKEHTNNPVQKPNFRGHAVPAVPKFEPDQGIPPFCPRSVCTRAYVCVVDHVCCIQLEPPLLYSPGHHQHNVFSSKFVLTQTMLNTPSRGTFFRSDLVFPSFHVEAIMYLILPSLSHTFLYSLKLVSIVKRMVNQTSTHPQKKQN